MIGTTENTGKRNVGANLVFARESQISVSFICVYLRASAAKCLFLFLSTDLAKAQSRKKKRFETADARRFTQTPSSGLTGGSTSLAAVSASPNPLPIDQVIQDSFLF